VSAWAGGLEMKEAIEAAARGLTTGRHIEHLIVAGQRNICVRFIETQHRMSPGFLAAEFGETMQPTGAWPPS
jgi:hypothetical protein